MTARRGLPAPPPPPYGTEPAAATTPSRDREIRPRTATATAGPESLLDAWARPAKRIPGTGLRAAATLLVLAAVAVAFLQYGGAGTPALQEGMGTVLPSDMIMTPSVPDWQQALDAAASFMAPPPAYAQSPPGAFVTTWETTGANDTITIPVGGATGSYAVAWGDGTSTTHAGDATHTYATPGNHTVSISGNFTRIHLSADFDNADKLMSIDQWGDVRWATMREAFEGASNVIYNATDSPDLSGVTDMSFMFQYTDSFGGNLSNWDVSGVTRMDYMFSTSAFNGNLSGWDVSGVTDMSNMFSGAVRFNGDISGWNVSGVTRMSNMFFNTAFNGDISGWDVSGVTRMDYMFRIAPKFNGNLSGWDVSGVTHMIDMFRGASAFNGNLSGWDVSGVTDMSNMFNRAISFNGDISTWNVSSVKSTFGMFNGAAAFNGNLSGWDVSGVTTMDNMFRNAPALGQNLGNWYVVLDNTEIRAGNTSGVVGTISAQNQYLDDQTPTYGIGTGGDSDTFEIVSGSHLNMNVSSTKPLYTVNITSTGGFGANNHRVYSVTVDSTPISAQPPDGPFVTTWQTTSANETVAIPVGGVTGIYAVHWGDNSTTTHAGDASHTYATPGNHTVRISGDFTRIHLGADSDNADKLMSIDQWGNVRWASMYQAFRGASNVIHNATDSPDLSDVTRMSSMFQRATSFDGNLSGWNVSGVTKMDNMFRDATSFDGNLSGWDVSQVNSMISMFRGAATFDGNLSGWDVSSVVDMGGMFRGAATFDGNLSGWDVSGATNMGAMFRDAATFDGNLSGWDVSGVVDMGNMFRDAATFDGNLSGWDVSKVNSMISMFRGAATFDGNLSGWDVSGVTQMGNMFRDAAAFNGDISGWNVSGVTQMYGMFDGISAFDQNLGPWYIVLGSTTINLAGPGTAGGVISAQNAALNGHNPAYGIGAGGDSDKFQIIGGSLHVKTGVDYTKKEAFSVNITSSGGFGTSNHHRVYDTITVDNANVPPVLDAVASKTANEGELLTFNATAKDINGDPLTFSLAGAPPGDAAVTAGGVFTWTPGEEHDGDHQITVRVSDGQGGTASRVVSITVNEVNTAPVISPAVGNRTITEGVQISFAVPVVDPDTVGGDPNTLTFSLDDPHPAGAALTQGGQFTWTPGEEQDGNHTVTVRVSDGQGGEASEEITITVTETNSDPVLPAIADQSGVELTRFTFTAVATDSDTVAGAPNTLAFSLAGTPPGDAAVTAGGVFTWTPGEEHDGDHQITVRVSDGQGGTASRVVSITVNEANQPPAADAGTYAPRGEGVPITLDGSDSTDGDVINGVPDSLSYLWRQIGSGDTVAISGAATASPAFTSPAVHQNATLTFELTVTDGAGESSEDTATILIVDDVNESPRGPRRPRCDLPGGGHRRGA